MDYPGQGQHPLTTEEQIHTNTRHNSLELEITHLNVLDQKPLVSPTVVDTKPDSNTLSASLSEDDPPMIQDILNSSSGSDKNDTDSERDDLLSQTTEANKYIPFTQDMDMSKDITQVTATDSDSGQEMGQASSHKRKKEQNLLVFSESSSFVEATDRYIVTTVYGAGPTGTSMLDPSEDNGPRRHSRAYMVACDFSDDSYYAMEWVMGTMMRDGDELHVVAAVNREDNPEAVKKADLTLKSELKLGSEKMTSMARRVLGQMLLYNIN